MRSRSGRLATMWALAVASVFVSTNAFTAGSEGKPTASASASKPVDKPVADAGPTDGGLGPVDGSTLPPGHPPVGDDLPPGHPHVGGDAHGDPHAAGDRHGQRDGFFEAPPDTAVDDPSLPAGTIVVTIKDADDRPIPNAAAVIGILESSVARGDSRKRRPIDMDANGTARVDGLSVGAATSYHISTTRGPGSYASSPFSLSSKAGKRVVLHAYEATSDADGVMVGMQAFVFVSLREKALSIEQMFNVFNIGKTAWVPGPGGATVVMPEGYEAFSASDAMADVRFVEGKNDEASLTGTLGPGQNEANFQYHVPLDGSEQQTIRIALPPRVGEVRVISEAGKTMGLDVAGFPDAQKQQGRDGRKLWITARQASQGERGIRTLDITITGLPTPGPGRWIAVLCAMGALALAGVYLWKQGDEPASVEARNDLLEAREALLSEFVTLEVMHRKGDVGPKTYAQFRERLFDALARIEAKLEGIRVAHAQQRGQGRTSRAEAHGEGDAS